MAEIVNARDAWPGRPDAGVVHHDPHGVTEPLKGVTTISAAAQEHRVVRRSRNDRSPQSQVPAKLSGGGRGEGNPARLMKLRLMDAQNSALGINVLHLQPGRLTAAKTRGVHEDYRKTTGRA